jgi:hypothetical protein
MAKHLPAVCLSKPSVCQGFACDSQAFANGLFVYDGQGFANSLPATAKHLPTVCLLTAKPVPTVCL